MNPNARRLIPAIAIALGVVHGAAPGSVVIDMPAPPRDRSYLDSPSATPKRYRIDDAHLGRVALQRYSSARTAPSPRVRAWGLGPRGFAFSYGYAPCAYGYGFGFRFRGRFGWWW